MTDPRAFMTFKCQIATAQSQGAMRDFGNAVGKIGDLQILNSIGAGQIGQGLRTLAHVSNSIRTGCGSLPSSIGSTIETGANWVLSTTGISPVMVEAVRGFNPGIANQAWGQAQQIYQQVKQGHFKSTDIPGYLQDFQNLERLGRNIFTSGSNQQAQTVDCLNSPYALDLISRAPKSRFIFVVSFIFNPGYNVLDNTANEVAFVIKKSSRPNMKFTTEDVNYYNFRSKFITKTEFDDMEMVFHDDMTNNAMKFYNAVRNAISPISNMGAGRSGLTNPENSGMDFSQLFSQKNAIKGTNLPTNYYSASVGPLYGDQKGMLRAIRLFHVYDGGRLMNVFEFHNPRITDMSLSELDMSSSEGSEVDIKFNYDSVYIETGIPANTTSYTSSSTMLPGNNRGSLYPLRYNTSPGAMSAPLKNAMPYGGQGQTQSCDASNPISTSFISPSTATTQPNAITNALDGITSAFSTSTFADITKSSIFG